MKKLLRKSHWLQFLSLALLATLIVVASARPVRSALQVVRNDLSLSQQGSPDPQPENEFVIIPPLVITLPPEVPTESVLTSTEPLSLDTEGMLSPRLPGKQVLGQGQTMFASTTLSDDWLTWLLTAQHGYGSWGDSNGTEVRDTTEVVQTYRWIGLTGTSMQAAGNWAEQLSARNVDYLARQILTMVYAGEEVDDLDDQLIAMQNGDGGFGFSAGYGSDPLSTLVALQALEVAGHHIGTPEGDSLMSGILYYLLASQDTEGGWGYTGQDQSRVVMTSLVLESLRPYRNKTINGPQQFIVQTEIDEGLTRLKAQQNPDGGWGEDGSTVYQTALASMAILNLGDQPTASSGAQGYLVNAQQPDGSWGGDPFTTAVAKRALSAFTWGIANDNNTVATYFNGWQAGYIAGSIFYPDTMDYPIQVEKATFWLYKDFAGASSSVTVRTRIYRVTPDLKITLLAITDPIVITDPNFYPNSITIDFSSANLFVHSPNQFMVAVEYLDGSAGSTPSILSDSSINIATNRNFYSPNGGINWYEHYGFWPAFGVDPANKGYNMIRASIRTNLSLPQSPVDISGQAGAAQVVGIQSASGVTVHDGSGAQATNDLILSWSGVDTSNKGRYVEVDHYNIYRNAEPYFVTAQFNLYGASIDTSFTDPGALGDPNNNHYYVITGVDDSGHESAPSDHFGEYDFGLALGRYNSISLPLGSTGITDAEALGNHIATHTGANVLQVLKWNASLGSTGAYLTYEPGNPFSDNFTTAVGEPYFVLLDNSGTGSFPFIGDVPSAGSISFDLVGPTSGCHYNFISVPLEKGNIVDAAALATDIGDVSQVLAWDATLGSAGAYRTYEPGNPFSENFAVIRGHPYFVCMQNGKTWP